MAQEARTVGAGRVLHIPFKGTHSLTVTWLLSVRPCLLKASLPVVAPWLGSGPLENEHCVYLLRLP